MRILQCNLGRGRAATNLLQDTVRRKNINPAIAPEPNTVLSNGSEWVRDCEKCVALRVYSNQAWPAEDGSPGKDFAWIRIKGINFVECYISPNITLAESSQYLNALNCDGQES